MRGTTDLPLEGLVHDLNNVFQTIVESAGVLYQDPKWIKLAATLQRSADRGQRLIQSILDQNRSPAEAADVIDSATRFARDYLECVHGPALEMAQDVEPGLRLPGDPAAWERVLVNLLVNAAEAGAGHVSITARKRAIVVRDDGPGISPDLLPHIFQPHVSSKSIMSGLGLYVVQSLVEQHGGTVTAENLASGGARFKIGLA
ncbi:MAG: sensor histidine kinase [Bryobacteraceae bacterium]